MGGSTLLLALSVLDLSFLECASTGFRGLRPTMPTDQIDFWRVERFFKFQAMVGLHRLANGTALKPVLYRFVGVRVGRRLFDDGSAMSEKNMVTIGDDVTLNAGCIIQCHSQEDDAFKSADITIGNGCTVGWGPGPLRHHDGRRLGARPRLLPHERRGGPGAGPLGWESGPGDGGRPGPCPSPASRRKDVTQT